MNRAKFLLDLALPTAIIIAARLALPLVAELPAAFAGIKAYGVYFVIALGAVLALVFRRGRIVFALITLALAYFAYGWLARDALAGFRAHTLFAALSAFVPLNLALLCVSAERGIFNVHGLQRVGLIAGEVLFTLWVVAAPATWVTAVAISQFIDTAFFAQSPVRQLGWMCLAVAMAVTIGTWLVRRTPLDASFAGAVLAFTLALHFIGLGEAYTVYLT